MFYLTSLNELSQQILISKNLNKTKKQQQNGDQSCYEARLDVQYLLNNLFAGSQLQLHMQLQKQAHHIT